MIKMNKKMRIKMRLRVLGTRKMLSLRRTRPGQVEDQSNKVEEMENMAEGGGAQG